MDGNVACIFAVCSVGLMSTKLCSNLKVSTHSLMSKNVGVLRLELG